MSRIVYYLGAGASYGRKEGRVEVKVGNRTLLEIKEGLNVSNYDSLYRRHEPNRPDVQCRLKQ